MADTATYRLLVIVGGQPAKGALVELPADLLAVDGWVRLDGGGLDGGRRLEIELRRIM